MTKRVLVNEKIADSGIDLLRESFDVTVLPGWSADELRANIGEFDALIVRSATKVTADLVDAAERLQVIGRAGVGVDNVDLDAASRRGVIVVNAPTSTVLTVAEHTLALMFALARNIARGDATMRAGQWERSKLGGVELAGKQLVLLGMGRIGQLVAERARSLGMHVAGYDPFVSPERFARLGIDCVESIDEALRRAHFLSLHMPLNDDTRGMIGARELGLLPKGARLVNTARGALVDLDAIEMALDSGQLAGAALDVFPTEPPPPHPVFEHPNVLLTPHLAASTAEAQDRAGVAVAEQVKAALTGGAVTTAVNIPAIAAADVEALQPYVPLVSRLARMAASVAGQPVTRLEVCARGDVAAFDVRMLTFSALVAMLSDTTDEPVTFVNARHIAERRGIEVEESTDPHAPDYDDLIEVRVVGTHDVRLAGTTIGQDDRPWLVSALGSDIEIELAGNMALFRYADVPGMIGRVGVAFGEAGVNIANMAVSRGADGDGKALMAMSFDASPPADLVSRIESSPDFDWAALLQL
jgi:D-3-phosphoglycerate dehydrogenase / 2-oxoglutarate reductase